MTNLTMYSSNYQCIHDHLQYLNLVLAKLLLTKEDTSSKGLYISKEEVWEVMDSIEQFCECDNDQLISSIYEASKIVASRAELSLKCDKNFAFLKLQTLFGLNQDEILVILLLVAEYVNPKYKKIYAYLNNDVTQKSPTIDIVLDLIANNHEERFKKRNYFHRSSPLLMHGLINMNEDKLSLNERFKDWLLEINCVDREIEDIVEICSLPNTKIYELPIRDLRTKSSQISWLTGIDTSEKIRWVYNLHEREVLVCKFDEILAGDCIKILELVFREALLRGSCILFTNGDFILDHKHRGRVVRFLHKKLQTKKFFVYICGQHDAESDLKAQIFHITLPKYKERLQIWRLCSQGQIAENKLERLAKKYALSFEQIKHCCLSWIDNPRPLDEICNEFLIPQRSQYFQLITPQFKWKDIVLVKEKKQEIKEISYCMENRHFVLDEWNFKSKLGGKRGINIVFSGGPGTGKTMTANILANTNKMNLYRVDTASIVDKYIGETEKKLKTIFEQVADTNSILFFDEADSLFGKRGEVQRAQDRYANVTVSYLLQKIEDHSGIIILATNLIENLDKAFVRRMNFIVQFPHPSKKQRMGIWKKAFPPQVPLENIDYGFLAEKINLSGGYLKNIAWLACFYAAEENRSVGMSHIIRSVRREYQKIGKAFLDSDFAPYALS